MFSLSGSCGSLCYWFLFVQGNNLIRDITSGSCESGSTCTVANMFPTAGTSGFVSGENAAAAVQI